MAVQEAFQRNCKSGNKSALRSALFSEFKREFIVGGVCRGLADVLLVLTPYTLRYLIKFADDSYVAGREHTKGPPVWQGIAYLAAVIIMLSVQTLAHNYYWYLLGVIGGESRAVLTAAIFDKAMRVEGRGRAATVKSQQPNNKGSKDINDSSTGHLTNLLSVDCARVAQGAPRIHFLWTAPLSIILAITLRKILRSFKAKVRMLTSHSNRKFAYCRSCRLCASLHRLHCSYGSGACALWEAKSHRQGD